MANSDGFFGSVFGSRDEDPLLHPEDKDAETRDIGRSNSDVSSASPESNRLCSVAEERSAEGDIPEPAPDPQHPAHGHTRMRVVLYPDRDENKGLRMLNDAVEDGWRLSDVTTEPAAGESPDQQHTRVILHLRRAQLRSLFHYDN
jgi:hypothetical protein